MKDDVLTLLVHLGYLAYDSEQKGVFIPNKEIIEEFENAMRTSVAEGLDRVHMEVASRLDYNDENSLSCAIGLAYYSARKDYKMVREFPTGRGFADVIFLPLSHSGKTAIVLELKYNQSAHSAIQQIKDRHYTQALEGYAGEILLVGINYNKEKVGKNHSCVLEKLIKPECD